MYLDYSSETLAKAQEIINDYCQYDTLSECYTYTLDDVFSEDLLQLTAYMMLDNPELADEAFGHDNEAFAIFKEAVIFSFLKSGSQNRKEVVLQVMTESVSSYFKDRIENLLDYTMEIYNQNKLGEDEICQD